MHTICVWLWTVLRNTLVSMRYIRAADRRVIAVRGMVVSGCATLVTSFLVVSDSVSTFLLALKKDLHPPHLSISDEGALVARKRPTGLNAELERMMIHGVEDETAIHGETEAMVNGFSTLHTENDCSGLQT